MKCQVCGADSGKYPLCRVCNIKKEKGEIIKCSKCNSWHYANASCPEKAIVKIDGDFVYEAKSRLISKAESGYFTAIKEALPSDYYVFPQINLAAFINRVDNARFHNELFRNVDFLITDEEYNPKIIIEINDQSHLSRDRKERDEKVKKICEEAGLPTLVFWTSYGVNPDYIKKKIDEVLSSLPIARVHHFKQAEKQSRGCYVATCVYGSYDCPEVWVLRRYRDNVLSNRIIGRAFIKAYYALSPTFVKWFGNCGWFVSLFKPFLDKKIGKLKANGIENTPYNDND